jgi:hypothetical protein
MTSRFLSACRSGKGRSREEEIYKTQSAFEGRANKPTESDGKELPGENHKIFIFILPIPHMQGTLLSDVVVSRARPSDQFLVRWPCWGKIEAIVKGHLELISTFSQGGF